MHSKSQYNKNVPIPSFFVPILIERENNPNMNFKEILVEFAHKQPIIDLFESKTLSIAGVYQVTLVMILVLKVLRLFLYNPMCKTKKGYF